MKLNVAHIPGTDNYMATDDGRILRPCPGGYTEMGYSTDSNGYRACTVRVQGRRVQLRVHRLILEAFVGPRPEGMLVRHLNDEKWDNRLDNLRWGYPEENQADFKLNHKRKRKKKVGGRPTLTVHQVASLKASLARGVPLGRLVEFYGVTRRTLERIRSGELWKEVEFHDRPDVPRHEEARFDPVPDIDIPTCTCGEHYVHGN